jgi:penicillin amidase
MPKKKGIVVIAVSVAVIILLATSQLAVPVVLLDPVSGAWTEIGRGDFSGNVTYTLQGLSSSVTIVFDQNLVPHVFAQNDQDAFFAVGFLHGSQRLWQMDAQRRLAEGRLSEVLGNSSYSLDVAMRTVGLARSANNTASWMEVNEPQLYSLAVAYSSGVNQAIQQQEVSHSLPLMFKLLDYQPTNWTPADTFAWANYMAWTLTGEAPQEPILTKLAINLGDNNTNLLFPVHPYYQDNVTVVPGDGTMNGSRLAADPYVLRSTDWFQSVYTGIDLANPSVARALNESIDSLLNVIYQGAAGLGSNDWAVGPSKSADGKAMLSDDPHLALNLPAIWYEVQISTPDMDVHGVTLPGIPFVVIGSNPNIAWGLTNTQISVMDFYAEKLSPNGSLYFHDGTWSPVQTIDERIAVKGVGIRTLKVNITDEGPIVSYAGIPISLKWTANAGFMNDGKGVTREALAIYLLDKSKSYQDLVNALKYWDVPSQNFAFADDNGNFGVVEPGLFPYRGVPVAPGQNVNVVSSRGIMNGTGGYDWQGYIPYSLVPKAINPGRGFVAAPNQMSVGPYYPYFILGNFWDPGGRAQRIFEDLTAKTSYTLQDLEGFQADIHDWYAASLTPSLIRSFESANGTLSSTETQALGVLNNWNYNMDKNLTAPTIWWAWFSALNQLMFEGQFKAHGVGAFLPYQETIVWLANNQPHSSWFEGDRDATFRVAFSMAIQALQGALGSDPNGWQWGKVHKLELAHLSGIQALSYGPVPEDGLDTLMAANIPYNLTVLSSNNVYVSSGPSWRIDAEMGASTPTLFGVYPGGQTENPLSAYYTSFVPMWTNYTYHPLDLPTDPGQVQSPMATVTLRSGQG